MTPADEWAELEALAKAATPGPWCFDRETNAAQHVVRAKEVVCRTQISKLSSRAAEGAADAAFIAAANPATILKLIEAARQQPGEAPVLQGEQ